MTYYYSETNNAFYTDELTYSDLPQDLITISDDLHRSLLIEMNDHNKKISVVNGEITIVDKGPPSFTWDEIRSKRDKLLIKTDYTDTLSFKTRMGDTVYDTWQTYRQSLRDIPQAFSDSNQVSWPTEPGAY